MEFGVIPTLSVPMYMTGSSRSDTDVGGRMSVANQKFRAAPVVEGLDLGFARLLV